MVQTPLQLDWIILLNKDVITVKPNTTNANLYRILCTHCCKYALTRGLLQKACKKTRLKVFGNPDLNATYFTALAKESQIRGYHVEVITANHQDAINRLQVVVLADEIRPNSTLFSWRWSYFYGCGWMITRTSLHSILDQKMIVLNSLWEFWSCHICNLGSIHYIPHMVAWQYWVCQVCHWVMCNLRG